MPTGQIEAAFPMTPLQEGMLYHTLRDPSAGVYRVHCTTTLIGDLVEDRFRQAWRLASRRHAAFRTFFSWEGRERPLQVVRTDVDLDVEFLDWRDASPDEQQARWRALLAEDRRRSPELTRAPLMRLVVARTSDRSSRFLWAVHHAVADGWSAILVLDEVVHDYAALDAVSVPSRPDAPAFDRFVGWTERQDVAAAEAFWRATFSTAGEPSAAVAERRVSTAARASAERAEATLVLDLEQTRRLTAAAARMRVTLNTMLMAAWAVLLARRSGSSDVTFGVTVSERPAEIDGVDRAVGLYLSTVPVRQLITGEERIASWVRALQGALRDGRAHAAPGLTAIHRWSGRPPGVPLFDSLVVFENLPAHLMRPFVERDRLEAANMGPLVVTDAAMRVPNDVPLVLMALPGDCLTLKLIRDPAVVSDDGAARLLREMPELLSELANADAQCRTAELLGPSRQERLTLLQEWAASPIAVPAAEDVLALFEARARDNRDALALRTEQGTMSYASLARLASRLAHRLRSSGVQPEWLVGIVAERSPELIAGMLAVLETGAAYVPLDPEAPALRLADITATLDAVLAPATLATRIAARAVIPLDDAAAESSDGPGPHVTHPPHRAAYVMFTSG
ncbi:MAG TPA: condensation domain-containing protein, partial [Gemmatimonadaceae bacterium]|nr:condensation domain-containing protein [Gemmatimonadaceae bacterium]